VGRDLVATTSSTYTGDVEDDESGEFYNAGGTEVSLDNSEIAWITDYQSDLTENSQFKYVIDDLGAKKKKADSLTPWKNASKLKSITMASGDIFLLYEIWNSTEYQYTAYMIVDIYGEVQKGESKICYPIRLHKFDSLATMDDGETIVIVQGNQGGFLSIYKIEASSNPNATYRESEDSKSLMVSLVTLGVFAFVSLI
jgi:hypothetical protein